MQSLGDFEYSQQDLLGHGAFALVFKGTRKKDHIQVAIKQIALKSVPGKLSSIRQKEITILKELRNTHIVQLFDYLETPSDIFLVMEFCNGGDMGDYLIVKKTLSESSIRHLTRHIALALEALFNLQIIHRDIKPQNLLLSYPSSSSSSFHANSTKATFTEATIKLADFGFARYLTGADMAATLCGSPLYMAPEILMGQQYNNSADLWSVGTILFQCLSGSAPFLASNPHALRKRYEREKLVPKIPEGTSHHLNDLLLKLLKKNPKERLSYSDFFQHDFLRDPSSFSSDPLLASQLFQRAKSSPVPIKRQPNLPHSSSSPRQSISPHRGSSVDVSSFSPSSFSGPPLSHKVGSQASLPYYSALSPNADVMTDQGFILVDYPGGPSSRRCSGSSGGCQSSGRSSALGHAHSSHTSSSAGGSLSRYSSLTTPFYQVSPRQGHQQGNRDSVTPKRESPTMPPRTNHHNSLSSAGPSLSNSVPFGKLIQAQTGYSPMSNISFNSHHSRSSPISPFSTPPSSIPSPSPHHGPSGPGPGVKCAPARRNSSTKLSSLTEERETKKEVSLEKNNFGGFDAITQSCLLNSDDDDDDDVLEVEEENFPLGLSLTSSLSTDQEDDVEGFKCQSSIHSCGVHTLQSSGCNLHFTGYNDAVRFFPGQLNLQPGSSCCRPASASSGNKSSRVLSGKPKRASSFSCQHNPRLSQELADINSRAISLSAHGDPHEPNLTTPTFNTSPSAEIVNLKVPFHYSEPSPDTKSVVRQPQRRDSRSQSDEEILDGVNLGSLKWSDMMESLILVREMQAMARARQGPILFMSTSTDLSDSGVAGRQQRCSEQLVLYAKSINILDSLSTRYKMELALTNYEQPPDMKKKMDEVIALKKICLEDAKQVRQELLSKKSRQSSEVKVSAERLLFLEALDMCKAALLDEKSEDETECIKRYRKAKLIFRHLLLEAQTLHDKQILQKYIQSAQARITHLL